MKKLKPIITAGTLFICTMGFGQGWFNSFGGEQSDDARSVTETVDGGYFVKGRYRIKTGLLTVDILPLLLKYNSDGILAWSKILSKDRASGGILPVDDGGYLIFGDDSTNESALLKINQQGDSIWQKSYEFDGENEAENIVKTTDGFALLIKASSGANDGLWLVCIDSIGDILSEKFIPNVLYERKFSFLTYLNDGGFLITSTIEPISKDIMLTRVDESGNILWELTYGEVDFDDLFPKLEYLVDGGFLMAIRSNSTFDKAILVRIDDNGNILWELEYGEDDDSGALITEILQHPSGNYLIAGFYYYNSFIESADRYLAMIDDNGEIIWWQSFPEEVVINNDLYLDMTCTDSGDLILTGAVYIDGEFINLFIEKLNDQGEQIWLKTYDYIRQSIGSDIKVTSDGGLIVCGEFKPYGSYTFDAFILKTDSEGYALTNFIDGNIYRDSEQNCVADPNEIGLAKWIIKSELGYTISDDLGNFDFTADSTNQQLEVFPPSSLWNYCLIPEIEFNGNFDTVSIEIGAIPLVDCPALEVDISTPFLRRCFPSTYYVNYCNTGTIAADTAYIEVTLDTFLNFLNSSIPLTSQNGNVFTFDLDTIDIGECGNFTIDVEVGCGAELGQTHCVEAHIFPDSLCTSTPLWSGGSIEVDGNCVSDTIHFSIKNAGNSAISPGLDFIVIEDDVILYQNNINTLGPGEVQEVSIENIGATYRLEADQEPNHPGNSNPTFVIEGCGQGFTPGFINLFPMDDADPFIDIDCRINVGSYDPNDKLAFPIGYDEEHFIEQNTDIEYLIRFQNTGTDTAFRVDIRDTLSPFLDVTSVRPGASSHPYEFDISGPGILKFTFDNILLPDSTANEAASRGFIKYKISQKENVPLGSKINNNAAIYFDFNAPIITNTTWHTVGEDFITILVSVNNVDFINTAAHVFPNPFSKTATVLLEGSEFTGENTFLLYNSMGHLVQEDVFKNNRFELDGEGLPSGIYIFQIKTEGGVLAAGKVVLQ